MGDSVGVGVTLGVMVTGRSVGVDAGAVTEAGGRAGVGAGVDVELQAERIRIKIGVMIRKLCFMFSSFTNLT